MIWLTSCWYLILQFTSKFYISTISPSSLSFFSIKIKTNRQCCIFLQQTTDVERVQSSVGVSVISGMCRAECHRVEPRPTVFFSTALLTFFYSSPSVQTLNLPFSSTHSSIACAKYAKKRTYYTLKKDLSCTHNKIISELYLLLTQRNCKYSKEVI